MATIALPGGRDVRATLDRAVDTPIENTPTDARCPLVVACPPHPRDGGSRRDPLICAVSKALTERGIDCLRFDYGPWDEGRGECRDTLTAVDWALDRTDGVGLFGYSFGGALALSVAANHDDLAGCSLVAPTVTLPTGVNSLDAFDRLGCPAQIVCGTRDRTIDREPVVERAHNTGVETVSLEADHSFVGHWDRLTESVGGFFERTFD